jgi:hypothetical protein
VTIANLLFLVDSLYRVQQKRDPTKALPRACSTFIHQSKLDSSPPVGMDDPPFRRSDAGGTGELTGTPKNYFGIRLVYRMFHEISAAKRAFSSGIGSLNEACSKRLTVFEPYPGWNHRPCHHGTWPV